MRYLFFVFLFLFPFLSQAQKGYRLIYNLQYQIDSTDINSVQDELFYLDMFGNESYFLSQDLFLKDSFLTTLDENSASDFLTALGQRPKMPNSRYIIHKTHHNNLVKHYEKFVATRMMYQEDINLDWQLLEDTLQIGNYICQKATTHFAGRNYTAWYTTNIALTAAPYKFNGLLGVIMRITDTDSHYQFDLLEVQNTIKSDIYTSVDEQELIEKEKFKIVENKMKTNSEVMYTEFGFQMKEETIEKMRKKTEARLKRENNPIELE
jgi:GLPGLI family protein